MQWESKPYYSASGAQGPDLQRILSATDELISGTYEKLRRNLQFFVNRAPEYYAHLLYHYNEQFITFTYIIVTNITISISIIVKSINGVSSWLTAHQHKIGYLVPL